MLKTRHFAWRVTQELPALAAHELAKLLWSLATLDCRPSQPWMEAFMVEAEACIADFDAESLAECIWALDKLDSSPGQRWTSWFVGEARSRFVARRPAPGPKVPRHGM